MKFRRILCILFVIALLSGCSSVASVIGTLSIDVAHVSQLEVYNEVTGKSFIVQNQESIRKVVDLINVFTLENGSEAVNGAQYNIKLNGTDTEITIVDDKTVIYDDHSYKVNADSLLNYIEELECDTMTDKELIREIFEVEYAFFSDLRDADGNFSLDKFLRLGNNCPAAFELISRPSAIESLGSYGLDLLKEYMQSDDNVLRQRAEDVAAFFSAQFPDLQAKIEKILENN